MSAKVLPRLLALRRLNEKKALDELIRCQAASRRCEEQAREASAVVRQHVAASQLRERQLLGSVAGQAVSLFEIIDLQAQIEIMGIDADRLRDAERDRWNAYHESVEALAGARAIYRQRQVATVKIELLVEQETKRGSRAFAALVEEEPFAGG